MLDGTVQEKERGRWITNNLPGKGPGSGKGHIQEQAAAANASSSTVPSGESPTSSGGRPANSRKKKAISSPAWPIAPHERLDGLALPETQCT